MRTLFITLLAGLLASCTSQRLISYSVQTEPRLTVAPKPEKFIILNTFDPTAVNRRKNIEEVSTELINSAMFKMAEVINRRMGIPAETVTGFTPLPGRDNPIGTLLEQHRASHAIVITYFDISFDQTDVVVTKTSEGKSREAHYNICNTINFELHDQKTLLDKSSYPICKPHSSRPVISGLLAAGPSYKNNKEDFEKLSHQNSQVFLRRYFPAEADVTRPIFVGGDFKLVAVALDRNDYEPAMAENKRIAESGKARTAAMALYNCAVLSERNNDNKAAHRFLSQSLLKVRLPQAEQMISEFDYLSGQ